MSELTPVGKRLALILEDKGFVTPKGELNTQLAAKVIRRRSVKEFYEATLRRIVLDGEDPNINELVQIADGLRVDVRLLLYDDEDMPNPVKLRDNPMDELDLI